MAWYNTGTIALTNGSATVTGSGTNFLVGAQIGEALYAPDGKLYEIQTINSATVITLASNYLGSTASTQGYQIIPTQSLVADLASDVTDLISDFADVRDYAGNGKFNDGAVGTPGITFTQDQDNGLYRIGSNNWALAAGGIKQVDLSATDVEINYAGVKKLATTATGCDVTGTVTADGLTVDGVGRIEETGAAARLTIARTDAANSAESASLDLMENNAANLSFGDVASFGYRLEVDGSTNKFNIISGNQTVTRKRFSIDRDTGNVSLYEDTGTTPKLAWSATNERLTLTGSDYQFAIQQGANEAWYTRAVSDGTFRLHRNGTGDIITASATGIDVTGTVTADGLTTSGNILLDGSGNPTVINKTSGAGNNPLYRLQADTNYWDMQGTFSNTNDELFFMYNGSTKMAITSAGNLTTRQSTGNNFRVVRNGDNSIEVGNYNATDGYQNTSYVSSTHTFYAGTAGSGSAPRAVDIDASGNLLVGTTTTPSLAGLAVGSTATGKNISVFSSANGNNGLIGIYQSNGTQEGQLYAGTGDVNFFGTSVVKIRASTGGVQLTSGATSWTSISDERAKDIIEPISNAVQKVSNLRSVIGKYKTDSEGTRRSFLIAQDVQAVFPEAVDTTDEDNLGVRYTETIPLLVAAMKEQQATIESLEARIAALES
jgi:hypothetical protein